MHFILVLSSRANAMKKHYGGLWSASLSFLRETLGEIHRETLNLLQRLVKLDISFFGFVVNGNITRYTFIIKEMSSTSKLEVLVVSSVKSCNTIL